MLGDPSGLDKVISAFHAWWRDPVHAALSAVVGLVAAVVVAWWKKIADGLADAVHAAVRAKVPLFARYYSVSIKKYRERVLATAELTIGLGPQAQRVRHQDVYVPVELASTNEPTSLAEILEKKRSVLILGPPGSGKTMLLRQILVEYATTGRNPLDAATIPVLVDLHAVVQTGKGLEDRLALAFEAASDRPPQEFVKQALKKGRLFLLLDGLDEVGSASKPALVQQLRDLLTSYPMSRCLITCRSTSVANYDLSWLADETLRAMEFSESQIESFLRRWPTYAPDCSADTLVAELAERPELQALARSPLLLTMIAHLYSKSRERLPATRAQFYDRATDLILSEWHLEQQKEELHCKRAVLHAIARKGFEQEQAGEDRRVVRWSTASTAIVHALEAIGEKDADPKALVDDICARSGLLERSKDWSSVIFTHLTFQEYFCACAFAGDWAGLLQARGKATASWFEVVRFWCARSEQREALLLTLVDDEPRTVVACLGDLPPLTQPVEMRLFEAARSAFDTWPRDENVVSGLAACTRRAGVAGLAQELLQRSLETPGPRYEGATAALLRSRVAESTAIVVKEVLRGRLNAVVLKRLEGLIRTPLEQLRAVPDLRAPKLAADIGSAPSLGVLYEWLWRDDGMCARAAAWVAASRFEALKGPLLASAQPKQPSLDALGTWERVWAPFAPADGNSAEGALAGRIARLLMMPFDYADGFNGVDPRIALGALVCHPEAATFSADLAKALRGEARAHLRDRIQAIASESTEDFGPWARVLCNAGDSVINGLTAVWRDGSRPTVASWKAVGDASGVRRLRLMLPAIIQNWIAELGAVVAYMGILAVLATVVVGLFGAVFALVGVTFAAATLATGGVICVALWFVAIVLRVTGLQEQVVAYLARRGHRWAIRADSVLDLVGFRRLAAAANGRGRTFLTLAGWLLMASVVVAIDPSVGAALTATLATMFLVIYLLSRRNRAITQLHSLASVLSGKLPF